MSYLYFVIMYSIMYPYRNVSKTISFVEFVEFVLINSVASPAQKSGGSETCFFAGEQ